jgi:hypothetical protein
MILFFNFYYFYMQNKVHIGWKRAYFIEDMKGLRETLCLLDLHDSLAPPSILDHWSYRQLFEAL